MILSLTTGLKKQCHVNPFLHSSSIYPPGVFNFLSIRSYGQGYVLEASISDYNQIVKNRHRRLKIDDR
jgi:hypothetical protein